MGVEPALAAGAVRLSLGCLSDEACIDRVVAVLPMLVERARDVTALPAW
jgi:cysteine sulfinate desulfinase/cysteine desulfurase-like protein